MTHEQNISRGSFIFEIFFLVFVLAEFSIMLAAVVSRFKYRLPPFPGASYRHDGRAGFDFAFDAAKFGFLFVLISSLPALICFCVYISQWRYYEPNQRHRVLGLFCLGSILWLPAIMSFMAYSF